MFQIDHIFGGLIGATIFFLAALAVNEDRRMTFTQAMLCVLALGGMVFGLGMYMTRKHN